MTVSVSMEGSLKGNQRRGILESCDENHGLKPETREAGTTMEGSWKQIAEINNQADKSPRWGGRGGVSPFISVHLGDSSKSGNGTGKWMIGRQGQSGITGT